MLTVLFKRAIWTLRMITVIRTTAKTPRQAIRMVSVRVNASPEELTEVGVDEVLVSFCFTVALD